MIAFIMTMFLACGDKDEDTAIVDTESATEPASEDTSATEETGSEEETEDTGAEEPADTGSAE